LQDVVLVAEYVTEARAQCEARAVRSRSALRGDLQRPGAFYV